MTKKRIIIDRFGNEVETNDDNYMLKDGERIRVPLRLMDNDPGLAKAMAEAQAIRRVETFDMSQHPQSSRYGTTDAKAETAREARDKRMADAWKNPPSVTKGDATAIEQVAIVGPSAPVEQLQAARDQVVANRDKRLEAAWR